MDEFVVAKTHQFVHDSSDRPGAPLVAVQIGVVLGSFVLLDRADGTELHSGGPGGRRKHRADQRFYAAPANSLEFSAQPQQR